MAKRSLVPETDGLCLGAIRWAGGGLVIEVEPREPPQCPHQRTFVAPLMALAYARQRRTRRRDDVAFLIGHAMGGRPAERLARRLGVTVSGDVILANLRRAATWNAESRPTRVIDVDEWSRRKGSDFGSTIVDLERRQVIDVLPDRTASSVEAWMRNHPDIEQVVRDRDGLYAEGANKGAPQAKQVADRLHLLHNLRKTIEAELAGIRAPTGAVGKPPSLFASLAGTAVHARVWPGGTWSSCARVARTLFLQSTHQRSGRPCVSKAWHELRAAVPIWH